jgi:hypothetical protein
MKKLELNQMENLDGGTPCGSVTGGFCAATALLAFSGVFACLAAATGIGCALGVYQGCHRQ